MNTTSIDFGRFTVGKSVTKSLQLTWTGHHPISISSNIPSGAGFSIEGVAFPLTLEPNAPQTIVIGWKPVTAGLATGQLSLFSETSGQEAASVSLSGTGLAPALTRLLQTSSAQLSFGTVPLNTSATQTLTLTSVGTGDILVDAPAISGTGFTVVADALPLTLKPTQSTTVRVQFTATSSTANKGQLVLGTNATSGGMTAVALSGSGAQAASAELSVSATTLSFGNVTVDSQKVLTLTLTSTGTGSVILNSLATSGSGYSLLGATTPVTLAPRQTMALQVAFDPTSAGEKTGELTIASNSATEGVMSTALSGSGEAVTHSVDLVWSAPTTSTDPVAGYNVYRSLSGQSFQKLNATPLSQTSYVDSAVADGTTYVYEVKSVDKEAMEGVASNTTDVSIP